MWRLYPEFVANILQAHVHISHSAYKEWMLLTSVIVADELLCRPELWDGLGKSEAFS